MRQVTHALLTRPPLSHNALHPERIKAECFARLACVKHAASVHPEPGSNSLKKVCPGSKFSLANFYPVKFTLVLFFKNYILLNFQGYVTVQLSRFFVFRCSPATFISYHVRFSLSRTFLTFFEKFLFSRTSFEHLRRSSLRR